jgi:4'-phosphopantetheinyl transferase
MSLDVDVWHVRTSAVSAPDLVAICQSLMAEDEATRHGRFVFDRHRHEYLVTRGLVRGVLGRVLERPPASLRFVPNDHGRPLLVDGGDLRFNLTNSVHLVACAVAEGREIGVDTEPLSRADEILGIVDSVFTAAERAALAALPLERRRRRAVELWTLKEAYMKARGLGMSLPVEKFEIVFDETSGRALRLGFHPPIDDVIERWALATFEVEDHLISTCTEKLPSDAGRPTTTRLVRVDLGELLAPPAGA